MRVIYLWFLLMVCAAPCCACLSEYREPSRVVEVKPVPMIDQITRFDDRAAWQKRRNDLDAQLGRITDFRAQNDLSVALVHTGEYALALLYLKTVEKNQPNLYRTADNLGTTYELMGDNRQALRWIDEGLKRNVESHGGSEWIHVKILETKLSQKTPASVLSLDFGAGAKPVEPQNLPRNARGETQNLSQIEDALKEQLHERLQFVGAPDSVVASLLFDLGNCLMVREEPQQAASIYELALKYKPVNRALLQQRLEAAQETWNFKIVALFAVFASGIGFFAWRYAAPRLRVLEYQTPADSWVENSYTDRRYL